MYSVMEDICQVKEITQVTSLKKNIFNGKPVLQIMVAKFDMDILAVFPLLSYFLRIVWQQYTVYIFSVLQMFHHTHIEVTLVCKYNLFSGVPLRNFKTQGLGLWSHPRLSWHEILFHGGLAAVFSILLIDLDLSLFFRRENF